MISNQILQNTIDGLKGITQVDIGILDLDGNIITSTFSSAESFEAQVVAFVNSPADSQEIQGNNYFKVLLKPMESFQERYS